MKDKVVMPKELSAANGAKSALIGEFYETYAIPCPDCGGDNEEICDQCKTCKGVGKIDQLVSVSWTNIKAIYAKAVELFGEEIKLKADYRMILDERIKLLEVENVKIKQAEDKAEE